MGRTSRCPGCKIAKSDHAFGKPGKDCQGFPPTDENDNIGASSGSGLAHDSATPDSIHETLASLVGAVQALCQDMRSLQEESKELWAKVEGTTEPQLSPSPTTPQNTGVTSRVTLPELRDMKDLVSQVDSRVSQLGLLSESSDENDGEEDLNHAQIAGATATGTTPKSAELFCVDIKG